MIFITGNKNKFKETKEILGIEMSQATFDISEIQHKFPLVVASYKADMAMSAVRSDFIIEDTGLFLGERGDLGALVKWLPIERIVKAYKGEKAIAQCVFVGYFKGQKEMFDAEVEGIIVEPRGDNGFGWDCIFQPNGSDKTFAEMTTEEKNKISPRYLALMKLKKFYERS